MNALKIHTRGAKQQKLREGATIILDYISRACTNTQYLHYTTNTTNYIYIYRCYRAA